MMPEKEKRKPKEPEYTPFWMYVVFALILLTTSIFPLFHILDAYPHINEYRSLVMPTLRWLGFILCIAIIIRSYLEPEPKRRNFLLLFMLIVAYATIFHIGVGLMVMGAILSPFAGITFIIFLVGLILMRVTTRKIYTWEVISLITSEIMLSLGIITFSWISSAPYHLINSQMVDNSSYHLVHHIGSSMFIELYECNSFGFFCESLYDSKDIYYFYDQFYDYDDNIGWKITQDENPTITIFVNDEVIHTEMLNPPSD